MAVDLSKPGDKKPAGVIDMTPTWVGLLPGLLAAIENGTATGRKIALEELTKVCAFADRMNATNKLARLCVAPEFDKTRSADAQRDFIPAEFAAFNHVDHLAVNVPDGGFTITCRTSQGKRVTLNFNHYGDGKPQMLDVVYHDNGTTRDNGGTILPTFDALGFGAPSGRSVFDTRHGEYKTSLVCILMEDKKAD